MGALPAEILAAFFNIPNETIVRDLRDAEDNLVSVLEKLQPLESISPKDRTAEIEAEIAHFYMVRAHELSRHSQVPDELKILFASMGAGQPMQYAERAATEKGQLAEIMKQIVTIYERETLAGNDFGVMKGDGPADFEELDEKFGNILGDVADTVFVFALRRYFLEEAADLYEQDYSTFERYREIGSRVVMGDDANEETYKISDEYLREEYGEQELDRMKARVRELRASLKFS